MFESTYYNEEERKDICKSFMGVLFADDNENENEED